MEYSNETNSNRGAWGAWQNVKKENELLKTKLLIEQENKFGEKIKTTKNGNIVPVNKIDNPFRFGNIDFNIEEEENVKIVKKEEENPDKFDKQEKNVKKEEENPDKFYKQEKNVKKEENVKIVKKEEEEDEDEEIIMCKIVISKKKNQIKELLSISNTKKKEFEENNKKILDEYNNFVSSNEENIDKLMKQIEIYTEIINDSKQSNNIINSNNILSNNNIINSNNIINNCKVNTSESTEVFVGSLPSHYKEKDLYTLLSPYGEITRSVVLSNGTESKCCGFVSFKSSQSSSKAINCLNGSTPVNFNKPILVEYSNTKRITKY